MAKVSVYEIVTQQILEALEQDIVPWRRPWATNLHQNIANKYEYRGINQLLCESYMVREGYSLPYWLTYKGAEKMGGQIKEDERKKSHIVVYWKWIEKENPDDPENPTKFPILRYYRVYNADQTEGIEFEVPEAREIVPNEEAQKVIDNMPNAPEIIYGGNSAYYMPPTDRVNVPKIEDFVKETDEDAFYATTFHELIHSTGHTSRLNREELMKANKFGDADYSREELVAEIGSAMLCAQTGIDPSTQKRAVSYIAGWKKKLEDDPKIIVTASSRATKAAKYVLDELDEDES